MESGSTQSPPDLITGEQLRHCVGFAADLLEANIEVLNSLNVFPVPDGDTGTNMHLTMQAVVKAVSGADGSSAGEVAAVMSQASMMEARGNSGIILSQFFKGLAAGLEGAAYLGPDEMSRALAEAKVAAYKAVANPVEGTMLTVIDWMARAAGEAEAANVTLGRMIEDVCAAAEKAVANTPTMLAVLREAGVVDAGGHGLAVIFEGFRRAYSGEASGAGDLRELEVPQPVGIDHHPGGVRHTFLASTDEELYGYCTQFVINGTGLDEDSIRLELMKVSQSTVVVGGQGLVRVHAHAEDPGPLITLAVGRGQLSHVSMENMDEQHAEFSEARRGGPRSLPDAGGAAAPAAAVSIVSVAWGVGLEELFTGLGASGILAAGDTMNPSVAQIVEAVERAPSDSVIFLPNNKNIVPAARQAAGVSGKALQVIPSRTIPQGIAALLAFSAERDGEENASAMSEAIETVSSGEVVTAQRTVSIGGVEAAEGQVIGLLDGTLVVACETETAALVELLKTAGVTDELVTLYWGGGVDEAAAAAAAAVAEEAFIDAEIELVYGGQPHYHFLVSIER